MLMLFSGALTTLVFLSLSLKWWNYRLSCFSFMATDTEIVSSTELINNIRSPAVSPPESLSQKSLKFMIQTTRQGKAFSWLFQWLIKWDYSVRETIRSPYYFLFCLMHFRINRVDALNGLNYSSGLSQLLLQCISLSLIALEDQWQQGIQPKLAWNPVKWGAREGSSSTSWSTGWPDSKIIS